MATFANTPSSFNPMAALNRMFTVIGDLVESYAKAQARSAELEFLTSKSDDELADMGLTREDIARHVFRDKYYI